MLTKICTKKIFLYLLLLPFVFSVFLVLEKNTYAEESRFPYFSDVSTDHKNFFAITDLMQKGVINGYADGTFHADKPVSRAETLKILLLGSNISVPPLRSNDEISGFLDVPKSEWFAPYIKTGKKLKIIKGRGDTGKFFPADTVNKAEALKMLLLVNKEEISTSIEKPYNDVEISDWFAGYFVKAQKQKIFSEKKNHNIYPDQTLTRGDLVEMMYQYSQFKNNTNFTNILPVSGNTLSEKMPEISLDAFEGITLDKNIIPVFRKGEVFTFSGKIHSGEVDSVSIIITNSGGESQKFSGDSRDGRFDIPVFFKDVGTVQIGILKGKSGSYISYEGKVFSGISDDGEFLETIPSPQNFSAEHRLGRLFLSWKSEDSSVKNKLFHIQFRQNEVVKNMYVHSEYSVLVPSSIFNNFSTGEIQVFIREAKIGESSLVLASEFSDVSKIKIAVFERFTETVSDEIEITSATYEYENVISVKGRVLVPSLALGKGYVLNSKEELFEKKLDISEISQNKNFSLTFIPKNNKKDFYVIEISDAGGRALAVLPISPKGVFPIIPNEFDKKSETLTKISIIDALKRVNEFRKNHGRSVLTSDNVIAELASIRAEDMKKRNYFSHTTPAGKTVNDFRSDLGVKVPLSENIAIHYQSGLDATYSLEFSPTHRKNLLDKNVSRIGLAFEEKDDGSIILVQLFAGEKLSESVLMNLQSEISQEIQKKHINSSQFLEASVLKKMTQQWADIMSQKKIAQFSYDSGETWDDLLKNYKIQRSSNVFIGSFPSQESLKDFIGNESEKYSEIYDSHKKNFAVSISVSEEGILFLCIIGEE